MEGTIKRYGMTGTIVYRSDKRIIPASYDDLAEESLPKINGNVLKGNKSTEELGIKEGSDDVENNELDRLWMEIIGV